MNKYKRWICYQYFYCEKFYWWWVCAGERRLVARQCGRQGGTHTRQVHPTQNKVNIVSNQFTHFRLPHSSVGDPSHFSADPDSYPQIRTSDYRIRLWIWVKLQIRPLSSVTLRMQKKFSYFFPRRHILFNLKNLIFLQKFCFKILFCKHY